nr:family 10 glycosylhydrolase [Paludifilum halophilum]
MTVQGPASFQDSFVGQAHSDTNYDGSAYLSMGNHSTLGTTRSYLRFDLPEIPKGSRINWAKLNFFHTGGDTTEARIELYPVADVWEESSITWDRQPKQYFAYSSHTVSDRGWVSFWITQLVRDWYNGTPNYGVCLKRQGEDLYRKLFYSSDYTRDTSLRPSVTIDYTPSGDQKGEYRIYWVDQFHEGAKAPRQVDRLIQDAKTSNANAIFLQVRRRADAYYNNSLEPKTEDPQLQPGFDPLADTITKAHAENLEVHAWFATMKIWNQTTPPAASDHIYNTHGDAKKGTADYWLSEDRQGNNRFNQEAVVDPGHPAVVDYTIDVMAHVAANYDVDGIHIDILRYMDTDWGYNPTAVARYNRQHGTSGLPDPEDPRWQAWRREQVNNLVKKSYATLLGIRSDLKISAATITWGNGPATIEEWNRSAAMTKVFQDWRRWMEQGWIDFTVPMNYYDAARSPSSFDRWIRWEKDHQYQRMTVGGVGIYLNTIAHGIDQIRKTLATSSSGNRMGGTALYSYAVTNREDVANNEFYRALTRSSPYDDHPEPVFETDAAPPEMPWKSSSTTGHLLGHIRCSEADTATVQVDGPEARTVSTDGNGGFVATDLPPGDYRVRFSDTEQRFTVTPGRVTKIRIHR